MLFCVYKYTRPNNGYTYMTIVTFNLSPQSKEVGVQLQEDLIKVLNELYTVRKSTIMCGSMFKIGCLASCSHIRVSFCLFNSIFNFN